MTTSTADEKLAMEEKVRMLYKRYPVHPDRELLLWEDWIKIRNEETAHLGKKLSRPPVDLNMNLCEKVREDKERKIILEHAKIEKKVAIRGSLWEQPERLKQQCDCTPVYELHRTPAELGSPPIIEHIGVPHYIQATEKGLSGEPQRNPCVKMNANYEKYRKLREDQLQEKIKPINPFTPDIDKLLIIGSKPEPPPVPLPLLPTIKITPPAGPHGDAICGVYAIKINNSIIFKDIRDQNLTHLKKLQKKSLNEPCYSWTFYYKVPLRKIGRSKLFLKNLGTVTLRYCWKRMKKTIPYVPEDVGDPVFFFNKNEDVLPPGQSKELSFTFISDKAGIFSEFWEISMCNICFFDVAGTKLAVNLYADAVERGDESNMNIEKLQKEIDKESIRRTLDVLSYNAVDRATVLEPLVYPYKKYFLDAELFVMQNPVCFYHQTEVASMREKYGQMCDKEWDLSIGSWRKVMMGKEFDDRMAAYEFLKNSHSIFLRPWYEGDDLLKEKHRAVNLLLGQLFDKFYDEFTRISELNGVNSKATDEPPETRTSSSSEPVMMIHPLIGQRIYNIWYICMYEHIATTIELCAGVLSSLDLNRWIEFNFCHYH